jgi:hypothetical protein
MKRRALLGFAEGLARQDIAPTLNFSNASYLINLACLKTS